MADQTGANAVGAGGRSPFASAGTFEYAQTEAGWEFRPNEDSARRVATLHSGCLTLAAFTMLLLGGMLFWRWLIGSIVSDLRTDWLAAVIGIACAVTLLPLTPLLIAWARHVFAKSLRDNWLTMHVPPGGSVLHGTRVLVEAGRARGVAVRTVLESDGEGGTTTSHRVEVVGTGAYPSPIPVPFNGMWHSSVSDKRAAEGFAEVLARALGVIVSEPAPDTKAR